MHKRILEEGIMNTSEHQSSWSGFWKLFAIIFVISVIANYLVAPDWGINTTYPLKIVVFFISYGGPFVVMYFVIALPFTVIVGRIAKSPWRGSAVKVFNKALWPAIVLSLLEIYGFWYAQTH